MKKVNKKPRILLYDIETAPNLAYVWGKYQQDVIAYEEEWYMLSFAYKWFDGRRIYCHTINEFSDRPGSDKSLVKKLWKLFDEADIIIAHNGDAFDNKKSNARFLYWNMKPPSPYKTIDTLKIARRYFKFNSNRLDDLAKILRLGQKVKHAGFDLWLGCMQGDESAWKTMIKYNKHDVNLLEKIYMRLRAWTDNHPNVSALDRPDACPACGSSSLESKGWKYMKTRRYRQYKCRNCGKWCSDVTMDYKFKKNKK